MSMSNPLTVSGDACTDLLWVIANETSQTILKEAAKRPVSIDHLEEECESSRTTIYRRLNELADFGLIKKGRGVGGEIHTQEYVTTACDEVSISFSSEGVHVQIA